MKQGKLRILEGNRVAFWCTGCEEFHVVLIEKDNPDSWGFNEDYDNPTFTPSVLVRTGHHVPGHSGSCWCTFNAEHPENPSSFSCTICHSFVRDGKIQYLSDCTHKYAGQTVDINSI